LYCVASICRKTDSVVLKKSFLDGLGVGAVAVADRRVSNSKSSIFLSLDASDIELPAVHIPNNGAQRTFWLKKDIPACFSLRVPAESLVTNFENLFRSYPPVDFENLAFRLFSDVSWKLIMPELSKFTFEKVSFDLDALEVIITLKAKKIRNVRILYPSLNQWIKELIDGMLTEVINIAYQ
jgi:hypothetical protein